MLLSLHLSVDEVWQQCCHSGRVSFTVRCSSVSAVRAPTAERSRSPAALQNNLLCLEA
jgi:hypothetical protein